MSIWFTKRDASGRRFMHAVNLGCGVWVILIGLIAAMLIVMLGEWLTN